MHGETKNNKTGCKNTVKIFSVDISMEFRVSKSGIMKIKKGKCGYCERTELGNNKEITKIDKAQGQNFSKVLHADLVKHLTN